jgi:hypothetical protein
MALGSRLYNSGHFGTDHGAVIGDLASGFGSFVGAAWKTGTAVVVPINTARSVDRLGLRLLKTLAGSAG